jgi:hypothetical protein
MKPLVLCFSLVFASLILFGLAGCRNNPASLVGTYSVEENGKLQDFLRVEKSGDTYTITEKDGKEWLSPAEVTPAGEQEVEDILGSPVKGLISGLGDRQVAVLKVPPGWKMGAFECKTGFWLASTYGPVELHKN